MTIDAYINPNFTLIKKLIFFLLALVGIIICDFLILGGTEIVTSSRDREERKTLISERFHNSVQLLYEMIISATSVMSFACAYVVLNHVYSLIQGTSQTGFLGQFMYIWENWKDFVLLLLICLSCVLNTILDKLIIPLKRISRDDIACVRMLGMFYVIIILMFLNVIGDESEYSPVMMYYLGLMIGRFVYFDASFKDFLHAMRNIFMKLPLLMLGLTLSGLLCFFGFEAGYLLERNYYIVGAFYTHLFLLAAVFVFHHSHILYLVIKKR
ncbi:hypothetical protein [Butyrivibrio sp. INlla16]|uniref:hypothetical protein n=1 Tax=Butyrivibrio sp. INlla16 TaxID=1520807 RepID=UPI0008859F12|nr:hypothetical protein [Butyrivibrio sp. INlla16]SDB47563.1 hypothetical protein SAMN02910263_02344 [Butyrivibrio sp. INlla16]